MAPVQLRPHYRLWMHKTFPFMVLPSITISSLIPGLSLQCLLPITSQVCAWDPVYPILWSQSATQG